MEKRLLLCAALLTAVFCSTVTAQEKDDNTFGGWFFTEVNHNFPNGLYITQYFEHENFQFNRLDCFLSRTTIGYKILPWLKAGVNYVPILYPDKAWKHFGEFEIEGTIESGNLKVFIRERYRHRFTGSNYNELRSRLKVAYRIPDTKLGIYLAPEVFTWGTRWMKTRHYVACTYNALDFMQIEGYYMYYTFRDSQAEHVVGLGLNFNF